ncbi:MAG TPA: penicillin-binding protein 2 [Bacteroidales bacterium]|nr:MAG: penicillin-binding protein 2 [Bacteroidetes bacterium GWF2_33_38]OFY76657.1 MAG: penicillin-binding protein 2 [Bacteroidetes bacterium RIFOXYA12_FULL_33_9]OFY88374.1 MAG: penicillin-binding protein 2 [Bacteroidetes bacterium RIFOXYA2_FULL_33_7]HBF88290.1 penicillin-binding protein 2 [Bacteroidales bacterium]
MKSFIEKKIVIGAIIVLIAFIYILRLFYLQVIDTKYKYSADNNVLRYETQYPARGLIYDRYGELMVFNEAAYDLMVIPRQINNLDTLDLCNVLKISIQDFREKLYKAKVYSRYKPSLFVKQLSNEDYAILQEKLHKYSGFFVQTRTLRAYLQKTAAHVLGYVGEVDDKIVSEKPYYKSGDYIGISGIEKSYEEILRGQKGVKIFMVDVHNRIKGSFANGELDTIPIVGKNIHLTISAKLQLLGEKLMNKKTGSIVAIEPSTGEILALVSSPSYDPNLLVGRVRSENYSKLNKDSIKPLFNRALMAKYPPGSIFKIVESLIGLEYGVINPNTGFACNKSLVNCHNHPTATNLTMAIQHSCNPYYFMVYNRIIQQGVSTNRFKDSEIGVARWSKSVKEFGLGQLLDIDLPGMKKGRIPDVDFYNRWYGEGRWAFSTIYSNGIGQGEVEIVPLQMANFTSVIANKGYYYTPHLIKKIENTDTIPSKYLKKNKVNVKPEYFDLVTNAMELVVEAGTARRAKIKDIPVCGKTGTAENPQGEDHSVFIAFAPRENPKIAIAVYVENAGFGGTWAAPIASLMIEQYLTDSISRPDLEKYVIDYK